MRWVRARKVQNALVFVAVFAVALAFGVGSSRPSGPTRITVLPVGDAITYLIEDDDGRRIIVGGGGTDAALRAFSERTRPWERRIDMLILPPPFRDHLPGATELVRRADVGRVVELGGPGAKPSPRYDPWQLATLDRGHIPERLWGHATIPLAHGTTLDLIAPEAPDGIPLKLPARAPKPSGSGSARTPQPPADPEIGAAPGGYLRLSNGATTLLVALGAPDATLPGFARLIGPTLFVAPFFSALPTLTGYVRPWALVTLFSGTEPDATTLPTRTLTVPQGQAFTMLLDPHGVRIQNIPDAPAWAARA
ncbi:MAG: hypothetical protein M3Z19_03945 [Chloroflexota bacterium]|nr:hypothetical protein [Chloroflexota bacterium]